ncbi:MAG: hypothetical protein AAB250_08860, partial [Bdellovibrionota bacterium]
MNQKRPRSAATAEEIDRLIARHEKLSDRYRLRATDPLISNATDFLSFAGYLEEMGRALREQIHRFGPAERMELITSARARLNVAEAQLATIEQGEGITRSAS